jgi:hypothetical protein
MLVWMGYALLAAAALGVTASLIDFAAVGRFRRLRLVWAGVFLASVVGPIVFSVKPPLRAAESRRARHRIAGSWCPARHRIA